WWGPRSSKPAEGLNKALCGFDSHTLPLRNAPFAGPTLLCSTRPMWTTLLPIESTSYCDISSYDDSHRFLRYLIDRNHRAGSNSLMEQRGSHAAHLGGGRLSRHDTGVLLVAATVGARCPRGQRRPLRAGTGESLPTRRRPGGHRHARHGWS